MSTEADWRHAEFRAREGRHDRLYAAAASVRQLTRRCPLPPAQAHTTHDTLERGLKLTV